MEVAPSTQARIVLRRGEGAYLTGSETGQCSNKIRGIAQIYPVVAVYIFDMGLRHMGNVS